MPYAVKGECRNTGKTHFKKGHTAYNKKDKIPVKCEFCKTTFFVHPYRSTAAKFCSNKCSNAAKPLIMHNRFFKGEKAGYVAKHMRIASLFGKADHCDICGATENKRFSWSNKDHKYSDNINDWQQLCWSCHMKYDYKYNGRRNQHMIKKAA